MANWSDNPQVLGNFNPYIQQLPIEEMSKIGIVKQGQYNEGVQRIQTQIDSVAGMDVIREVDKQYLQSKLSSLGTNLKTVAAGDFSNFQLVNSVGGMVNSIGKDENVQNAVYSTMKYRKEQQYGEQLRKEDKLSANREYDFNKEVNDWFNNPDVKASFNGKYKEHVDVNKKVLEIIGKLHPNIRVEDIATVNTINKDGSINYDQIADVMRRQGETSVDEGQIKTAVNSMLEANDIDELASQGRYIYKDASPQSLQQEATRSYTQSKTSYQYKLDKLERELLVTTDVNQQTILNNSINYFKSLLGDTKNNIPSTLDQSYSSIMKDITNNPDGARANLYTRNWLDGIANGFAYKEIKDEVLTSPYKLNQWKVLDYNLEQLKEQHQQSYRASQLNVDKAKLTLSEKEFDLKQKEFDLKTSPGEPYFKRSGDDATNNLESLQSFANYNNNLIEKSNKLLQEMADKSSSISTKVTPADILKNIEAYKDNKYSPRTERERERMDEYIQNKNIVANQEEILKKKTDEAYKEETGGLTEDQFLGNKLKGKSDINIVRDGITYKFSPKEIYKYLLKEKYSTVSYGGGIGGGSGSISRTIEDELSNKEQVLVKELIGRYDSRLGGVDPQLTKYLNSYEEITNVTKELNNKVTKRLADKMSSITGEFGTEQSPIAFKDTNEKKRFITEMTNEIDVDLRETTGNLGYDPKSAMSYLTSTAVEDVEPQFVRQGNNNYVQLVDKKTKKEQLIPISESFVNKNSNLGNKYLNKNLDLAMIMLNNNGSTNSFKDYNHAFFNSGKFGTSVNGRRTVTLPIVADLISDDGLLYPEFKVKIKNGTTRTIPIDISVDYNEFKIWLSTLTDEKIIKLLKTKEENIEQLILK